MTFDSGANRRLLHCFHILRTCQLILPHCVTRRINTNIKHDRTINWIHALGDRKSNSNCNDCKKIISDSLTLGRKGLAGAGTPEEVVRPSGCVFLHFYVTSFR